jgi:hypothetical protein
MLIAWQLKMSAYDSGSVFENSASSGAGPKRTSPSIQGWADPSFPIWRPARRSLASAPRRSSLSLLTCRWPSSCVAFNIIRRPHLTSGMPLRISGGFASSARVPPRTPRARFATGSEPAGCGCPCGRRVQHRASAIQEGSEERLS